MWKQQRDPLVHCLWQKHSKAKKLIPWAWSLCAPPAWLANLPALGYGWAQTRTCRCGTWFYQILQHVSSKLNKQFRFLRNSKWFSRKRSVMKKVPENNIGFLQRPILLDPCWQALVDARILVGKLPSREHLVTLVLSDPEIVLQEPSPPQKFRLRQSQRQAVRTRYEPVTSWLPGPIYSSCVAYLNGMKTSKMSNQQ